MIPVSTEGARLVRALLSFQLSQIKHIAALRHDYVSAFLHSQEQLLRSSA
jgi:hypothetical protein